MFAQVFGKNATAQPYRNAAGEGGDEGAGTAVAPKTYTQADLDAAVKKAVDEQVAGLKARNGEVIGCNHGMLGMIWFGRAEVWRMSIERRLEV